MLLNLINKVGKVVFVFFLVIALMISRMVVQFSAIDLIYTVIVVVYLIKYVRLKLS